MSHHEVHRLHRAGWLRAAVLGANDGIVSTASLIIGVASANAAFDSILLAGVAGLVAGAMSMAAGEYVSVSSQADIEKADIAAEQSSLNENYKEEIEELALIYEQRGLEYPLALEVAEKLMAKDALAAHARDELGLTSDGEAKPVQAAIYSATTFTIGAALPLFTAWVIPVNYIVSSVAFLSLIFLAILGGIAARVGGASISKGALRVTFWGAFAMALTAGVGHLFGVSV